MYRLQYPALLYRIRYGRHETLPGRDMQIMPKRKGRKQRKQERKNKGNGRLGLSDRDIWRLADILTRLPRKYIPYEAYYCIKCRRIHCLDMIGNLCYCIECYYNGCCEKLNKTLPKVCGECK